MTSDLFFPEMWNQSACKFSKFLRKYNTLSPVRRRFLNGSHNLIVPRNGHESEILHARKWPSTLGNLQFSRKQVEICRYRVMSETQASKKPMVISMMGYCSNKAHSYYHQGSLPPPQALQTVDELNKQGFHPRCPQHHLPHATALVVKHKCLKIAFILFFKFYFTSPLSILACWVKINPRWNFSAVTWRRLT